MFCRGKGPAITPLPEDTRKKARELLLKTRIYRFFAAAFAFAGLTVFLILYFRNVEGNVLDALSRPSIVAILLLPFLPAAVLSWMSARLESKFFDLLGGDPPPEVKKGKT